MSKTEIFPHVNIFLANFWTERNKGDAIIQVSLIRMFRKHFPNSRIVICSSYGANQIDVAMEETRYSIREPIDNFVGGLMPTYHETKKPINKSIKDLFLGFPKRVCGVAFSIIILISVILRLPLWFISKLLPQTFKSTFDEFRKADIIVLRGRNVREPSFMYGPYYLFGLFYHALVGIFLRKPVAFLGCSVWPLHNPFSIRLIKFIFERLLLLTLREELSYNYVRNILKICHNRMYVLPDLSFYLLKEFNPKKRIKNPVPTIGFTLVDWKERGEKARQSYMLSIKTLVKHISAQLKAKIVIIPQVTYDPQSTDEIIKNIVDNGNIRNIDIIKDELPIEDLINLYASLDFLVATRLHSAIIATSQGVPTMIISYDGGPKAEGIFALLGITDVVLDYSMVNPSTIIKNFKRCWNEKAELSRKAKENLPCMYEFVEQHALMIKQLLLNRTRAHGLHQN